MKSIDDCFLQPKWETVEDERHYDWIVRDAERADPHSNFFETGLKPGVSNKYIPKIECCHMYHDS